LDSHNDTRARTLLLSATAAAAAAAAAAPTAKVNRVTLVSRRISLLPQRGSAGFFARPERQMRQADFHNAHPIARVQRT